MHKKSTGQMVTILHAKPAEDDESDLELDEPVSPFVLPGEELSVLSSGLMTSTLEDEDVNGYDTDLEIDDHGTYSYFNTLLMLILF